MNQANIIQMENCWLSNIKIICLNSDKSDQLKIVVSNIKQSFDVDMSDRPHIT